MFGTFFRFIGDLSTEFFKIMPVIGDVINLFIILTLTVATIYWIMYMVKDPGPDENYLAK